MVVKVCVACSGNCHKEFVVVLTRIHGQLFVSVTAEIKGMYG